MIAGYQENQTSNNSWDASVEPSKPFLLLDQDPFFRASEQRPLLPQSSQAQSQLAD